jgi:hypothetical protein
MRHRVGQEGWLWTGQAWPDRFEIGAASADAVLLAGPVVEDWYVARPLALHPNPPTAPSTGDRVWRVCVEGGEIGFLVRGSGLLRWEVLGTGIVDGYLPDAPMVLELHPWPLPCGGSWYGAVSARVP